MSPNAPNKNSLDFLSDYYFNTKSPLALCREAKKRYPSLTFRQVKTWLQSKDIRHTPFINQFVIIFIDVFSRSAWVVPIKKKLGETLVNSFQSISDLGRSLESYRLNFSIVIFKAYIKKIASISSPQTVN